MHHSSLLSLACSAALAIGFVLAGCSSDDSETAPAGVGGAAGNSAGGSAGANVGGSAGANEGGSAGASEGGAAGSAAGAAGAAGAVADAGEDTGEPGDAQASDAPAGLKIKVTYGGQSTDVDINQAELFQNGGVDYSLLSGVITVALPSKAIADLQANFVAGDGYNPADKPSCAEFVPVAGDNLKKGWIARDSRNLSWDPSLGFPGCVAVKDLAEILVEDKK